MKRDTVWAFVLWAILTAGGILLARALNIVPVAASEEAGVIDDAMRRLLLYSIPVLAFVVTVLVYSVVRFRSLGEPTEDGPPVHGHGGFSVGWLVVTAGLATLVFVSPGLTGLRELTSNKSADLLIRAQGVQWHWDYAFPEYGLTLENPTELVLPVGMRIEFQITSKDVIHSFWIPAFRLKEDAVPGQVTTMYVTPTKTGSFEGDPNFRAECAELCGIGHARMLTRVRVVSEQEFLSWVQQMGGQVPGTGA